MKVVRICEHLTGYEETFPQKRSRTEEDSDCTKRKMFSVLRGPTLIRSSLMKAIQQNHKSSIYSKPPKERIGPVVGPSVFISQMHSKRCMDGHSCISCIKMSHNSRDPNHAFNFNFVAKLHLKLYRPQQSQSWEVSVTVLLLM